MKICKNCKIEFEELNKDHIYCCSKCRYDYRYSHKKEEIIGKVLEYYNKNKKEIIPKQIAYQTVAYNNNDNYRKKKIARVSTIKYIKLKDKVCENCGSKDNLHRHHLDYSDYLNILILCKKCHVSIHKHK